jgi:hypothetical protein
MSLPVRNQIVNPRPLQDISSDLRLSLFSGILLTFEMLIRSLSGLPKTSSDRHSKCASSARYVIEFAIYGLLPLCHLGTLPPIFRGCEEFT